MDASPPTNVMIGSGSGGNGGGSGMSSSQHSPTSARAGGSKKRNRSIAGFGEGSPGSGDDEDEGEDVDGKRRMPGVKRACNECRQQKLRCDVVQDPFSSCSRCVRLRLGCKIESNFKRVGKRSKNAEMEREIVELRRQLASQSAQTSPIQLSHTPSSPGLIKAENGTLFQNQAQQDQYMGNHEAVASLLDLRQGHDGSGAYGNNVNGSTAGYKTLGAVSLGPARVAELFSYFWTYYHPWLPILDPERPPDHYLELSELLFWTIISVAARRYPPDTNLLSTLSPEMSNLIWSRVGRVPQSYHIVKAMCLLCTWPLPTSSTSTDATLMVAGVMMHVAMHFGLHRPSHAQDFTKFKVELREENLLDRVKTWAACNIVAQSVATGYGQPPSTLYDWTLEPDPSKESSYRLPDELETRLRIEKFCDKVTKSLYSNRMDPVGLTGDDQRTPTISLLVREWEDLDLELGQNISSYNKVVLLAALFHLRLSVFFDGPETSNYRQELLALYFSTSRFLRTLWSMDSATKWTSLPYATGYILQMTVAAGFTLLKLLNSFFATHIDFEDGKRLFTNAIIMIRKISVQTNDLPSRLAEVLSQMWRGSVGGGYRERTSNPLAMTKGEMDGTLQLKVRCRMSMSLVFDSVWRWREEFQAKGHGNLDSAVKNPTNPESAAESSASSTADPSLSSNLPMTSFAPNALSLTPGPAFHGAQPMEANYEVFDPLSWHLDGFIDFPYPSFAGIDGSLGGVA